MRSRIPHAAAVLCAVAAWPAAAAGHYGLAYALLLAPAALALFDALRKLGADFHVVLTVALSLLFWSGGLILGLAYVSGLGGRCGGEEPAARRVGGAPQRP